MVFLVSEIINKFNSNDKDDLFIVSTVYKQAVQVCEDGCRAIDIQTRGSVASYFQSNSTEALFAGELTLRPEEKKQNRTFTVWS